MIRNALSLAAFRRFTFALSILVAASLGGTLPGCGDDESAPGFTQDAGPDARRPDGAVDSSADFDAAAETGSDARTDASDVGDAATDAADADAGPMPTLSVDNVTANEGSSGTTSFTFTITLSAASTNTVTVDYATADATAVTAVSAVGGADFSAASGTVTFSPGDTTKTVTVTVNGDATNEADETFTVTLSNSTNATVQTGTGTGTITNDDGVPALSVANALVVEGNSATTPASFTVTLSEASGQTVTVSAATADGTATAGSDYTAVAGTTVTFAPGETSKDVAVDVAGDTTIEANETFTLTLSTPTNATITTATGTCTIQNDDGAVQPAITIDSPSVVEGNAGTKVLNFTVTLGAAAAQVVTVDFATADGTATTANSDYQATTGSVTFALGEVSKTVSVVVVGDTANENDETFTVTLSNATKAIIQQAEGTGTITNDDAIPSVTVNDVSVNEGQAGTTVLTFTATLSAASGKSVSVGYATADGTATTGGALATGGQDYGAETGTAVFAPGSTTAQITVSIAGDKLNEADETFAVTLSGPSNATLGAKVQGTGTITNDDALPILAITGDSVAEGNVGTTPIVFTVSLIDGTANPNPSGRTVTANFTTANGTAVTPLDYTQKSGPLTFAPGETQKQISVLVNGDATAETNETFTVALSAPTNATGTPSATGTIQNDDGNLPLMNINDVTLAEGNAGTTTMTFTVTISATSAQPVTVSYATQNVTATTAGASDSGGQDYVAESGTLTFAPGESSKTIGVTINGDLANEGDDTFNVVLSGVSTTAQIQDGIGEGTIANDDALPTVSIADATIAEGNAGTKNMAFAVTLSAKSGRSVSVSYATADDTATTTGLIVAGGTDYAAKTGTLTFPAGTTSLNVTVVITGDTTLEPNDELTVTLASPVNVTIADGSAVGTITNDDASPTLSINNVTAAEGTPAPNTANTTPFVFTVTLSNASAETVDVNFNTANGTATAVGNDYFARSGSLTFLPGELTKTITVLVRKDATAEAAETFFVNLVGAVNATLADSQGQGTINNDD